MRTMLTVEFAVEAANQAIKEGTIGKMIQSFSEQFKPESSYFYASHGKRTAQFVFDMKDASMIPQLVEPFFIALDAQVDLQPVMNAEDLRKGLELFMKSPMILA